jgi:hypothetical protein
MLWPCVVGFLDEFLLYLRALIDAHPPTTIAVVHQLVKAILGVNAVCLVVGANDGFPMIKEGKNKID